MKQGELFSVQMYKDIPWVLATGGSKGELAIWDTEEDKKIYSHFKGEISKKATSLKKTVDKGLEADESDIAGGESSGWEDMGSDEEDEATKEGVEESNTKKIVTKKTKKSK